jgi:hypothetical protein
MLISLETIFAEVEDPRRKQGLRISLPQIFCMITISNLCGHFGGRAIARFAKANKKVFVKELKLKHGIPSHVIITDVLNRVNSKQLIKAFNKWASHYVPIKKGDLISGDGKALMSTVTNRNNSSQKYEAVVSVFCQQSGLVRSIAKYQNSKESEINIIPLLIKELEGIGMTFHADAIHTQKKQ